MTSLNSINKVAAVIPFFNEERTIGEVIEQTKLYVDEIICVDDGSSDNSASIAKAAGVVVLSHNKNFGKGKALRTGFEYALGKEFNYVITIDADMQHDPSRLPEFINNAKTADLVCGNRLNNIEDMPVHRRMSNKITSFLLTLKLKEKILDSQCGYRCFKNELLKNILPQELGFEAESEMLIKAKKAGAKFAYVDIPTIYGNDSSKMRNLEATFGFIKTYLKY